MSTLGDEIRAQKVVAVGLAGDLASSATHLRTQIADTDWVSSAAELCRTRLGEFARVIDALGHECTSLAGAIGLHATSVETQEAVTALIPTHSVPGVSAPPPPGPRCASVPQGHGPVILGVVPRSAGVAR